MRPIIYPVLSFFCLPSAIFFYMVGGMINLISKYARRVLLCLCLVVLLAACGRVPTHVQAPLTTSRLTTVADNPVITSSNSFNPADALGWRQETLLKTLGDPDGLSIDGDGHVFQYNTRHCIIEFEVLPVRGRTQVSAWNIRHRLTGGDINVSVCARQLRDRITINP